MKVVNLTTYGRDDALTMRVRPAHVEYVLQLLNRGWLIVGGPYVDGSGALFVYEVTSIEHARSIIAEDPYVREGVVTAHEVKTWDVFAAAPDRLIDAHTHLPNSR